ncbi:MAG: hypothetical protein JWN68_2450 [Nocardioides sp.]|uniref:hypothetical protein n=1 Tax=Nocardioides sp. TaxID=35761 RepID=UPI00260BA0F4|nr:hypothetical protein [Nocardioides sp.]MCW2834497.1 hypothetical protein [Nocardioides sp.]
MKGALVATAALTAVALTGCRGGDRAGPDSDYCQAVQEHQAPLSDIAASTEQGVVFEALAHYRDLADQAPPDLRDEWSQVISRIEALEEALGEADVEPSAYDPERTLKSLPAEERSAITAAARDLGDEATVQAMSGIEQQALDVCKTPLSQ